MCLSGEELNNNGLGHNKHIIKGIFLLGWALEGRVSLATGNLNFFYFANPSQSNLFLNTTNQIYCDPPPNQIIHEPPPLQIKLLYLIFNQ